MVDKLEASNNAMEPFGEIVQKILGDYNFSNYPSNIGKLKGIKKCIEEDCIKEVTAKHNLPYPVKEEDFVKNLYSNTVTPEFFYHSVSQ